MKLNDPVIVAALISGAVSFVIALVTSNMRVEKFKDDVVGRRSSFSESIKVYNKILYLIRLINQNQTKTTVGLIDMPYDELSDYLLKKEIFIPKKILKIFYKTYYEIGNWAELVNSGKTESAKQSFSLISKDYTKMNKAMKKKFKLY